MALSIVSSHLEQIKLVVKLVNVKAHQLSVAISAKKLFVTITVLVFVVFVTKTAKKKCD